MAITRTPIIDDDGSGTTGTVIDNAWKQELYNQIDAAHGQGSVGRVDITTAGTYHNVALPAADFVAVNVSAAATITGFATAREGQRVLIRSSAGSVTLPHASGSSLWPLFNVVTSAPTQIGVGGTATYACISGFYCLIAHDQGAHIAVPYSAANYTAGLSVDAGDVKQHAWRLTGHYLHVELALSTATFATNNTGFSVGGWPYDFVEAAPYLLGAVQSTNWYTAIVVPGASRILTFYPFSATFPAGTNTIQVMLSADLYVT